MTLIKYEAGKVTKAEIRLRKALRREHVTIEPQVTIRCRNGREYTVDVLVGHRLVVEVDGTVHDTPEQQRQDQKRDKDLTESGYKVLRVRNYQVWENLRSVVRQIKKASGTSPWTSKRY